MLIYDRPWVYAGDGEWRLYENDITSLRVGDCADNIFKVNKEGGYVVERVEMPYGQSDVITVMFKRISPSAKNDTGVK